MITVVHGPEWLRIRAQLRKEEKTLDNKLQRAQRRVVDEMAREAQLRVLTTQVQGGPAGHTGLRRRIARSLKTVHKGGKTDVFTAMKERDERNLPLGMDRPQGWAHPLFGDKSQWYRQRPVRPGWFTDTFENTDDRVPEAMEDVLERSVARIDRAGGNRFRPG
jgi:hypothetical protein